MKFISKSTFGRIPLVDYIWKIINKKNLQVRDTPFFKSTEASIFFVEQLKRSTCYLEVGSGGSSIAAVNYGVKSFTIESDKSFLIIVVDKIKKTLSRIL